MTTGTKEFLFEFLDNGVGLADFERWIYQNDELKASQPTLHQDLLQFDFQEQRSKQEVKNKLLPYVDEKEFNVWRTKRLLERLIDDKIDLILGIRKLKELYLDTGENFLPPRLGIGYVSELDDLPTPDEYNLWNDEELRKKMKKAETFRENIKRDARIFLSTLKS